MGKKKANGEGSITKRKDGRYMGRYTVESKRKAVYGDSFEEVRQKLNEILNEIAKGAYVEPNKYSVEKWLQEWLELYALPTVKRSTYISYEGYVRIHLVPEIGQIKLTSLSTRDLQKFFKEKAGTEEKKGLAPKTLRNIYNMLHSALDQAVADHKILRNPTLNVKLPKVKSKEMRVLTVEEQAVLQDAVSRVDELHAYGITFAVSTGVRLGELLALRWKDVNEKEHYIYVRRTLGRLQKVDEKGHLVKKEKGTPSTEIVVRSPKSELSMRKIPLFDELWNDLMAYKEKQNALKDALGLEYQDQGYIFATPLGHHNDPKVYQTLFKRIVAAAGIESANFHALRHTFATRALESGMDIKVLSALLGHAQASTTLNLYGHVLPDHKKISMEKMRGNYMSCSSISGSSDDTSADVPQTQDPIISTIEDAQHNQEPAISIAAEDIQGLELSGDTNTAMPQIHDSTADTNANEEQAQAS